MFLILQALQLPSSEPSSFVLGNILKNIQGVVGNIEKKNSSSLTST